MEWKPSGEGTLFVSSVGLSLRILLKYFLIRLFMTCLFRFADAKLACCQDPGKKMLSGTKKSDENLVFVTKPPLSVTKSRQKVFQQNA